MELRHIRYFVKLAEVLNFSQAAKSLYTTQSNLSKQIKQFEDELGVNLFIRKSKGVALSDYGEYFLPHAKEFIKQANSCISVLKDVNNMEIGNLNIGATYSFFPLIKETIKEFVKLHPGIQINLTCSSVHKLFNKLYDRQIDLAFSYKPCGKFDKILSNILFYSNLSVIVNKNHPLAAEESIRLIDLEKYKLALPSKGSQSRNVFENITYNQNYNFDICLETNDIPLMTEIISSCNMVGILSEHIVRENMNLKAIKIAHDGVEMVGSYHIVNDTYYKKVVREFLRLLIDKNSYMESVSINFLDR